MFTPTPKDLNDTQWPEKTKNILNLEGAAKV